MEKKLRQRNIIVADYNPNWVKIFATEKRLLTKAIGENALKIEHIGSTSVEGLVAKPIIDILIEVKSLNDLELATQNMIALGYIVKGENGIAGRRYFQKGGNHRSHHIHAFQTGDINLLRHRAFKEYLIAHPKIAIIYGRIKTEAALICGNNSEVYMENKNDFIQKYETLAIKWFTKQASG